MKRGNLRRKLALAGLLVSSAQVHGLLAQSPCVILGVPVWTNSQVQFTLYGEPSASYVIEASADLLNWTPVLTNTDFNVTRTITNAGPTGTSFYRARRGPLAWLVGGLTAQGDITQSGAGVMIDSFDSVDPLHSTNGMYDPAKRKAGGDVASDHGSINLQNVTIYGHLYTGPTAVISIGDGIVGDLNWTGPGIEACWWVNNSGFRLPDVVPPYTNGIAAPQFPGSGTWTNFLVSGNYLAVGDFVMSQNQYLVVMGSVTLYVAGNFNMKSQNSCAIIIDPGSTLRLFVGTTNTAAPVSSSLTQVNTSGNAMTFQYFGLPSNTSVVWTGPAVYGGTVYAPEAQFNVGGGGSAPYDYQGACVVGSLRLNGHFNFHFDENLRRAAPMR